VSDRIVLERTATPEGIPVVLFEDTWHEHVLDPRTGHVELRSHLDSVMTTVATPDHREPDPHEARERFYKQGVGPSRWLLAVVSFELEPDRIVTALGYRHGRSPAGWMP